MKRSSSGFTLTELLISMTIISIITVSSIFVYLETLKRARDAQRIADMETIRGALESYYIDHGYYPGRASDISILKNERIPESGQLIGIGDTCQGVNSGGNRVKTDCGWASIDDLLSPYVDNIPHDPLHDPDATTGIDHYYAYDPSHFVNDPQGQTPVPEPGVSCSDVGPSGVVFGFYKAESKPKNLKRDTCAGTHQALNVAHYNAALFPASP